MADWRAFACPSSSLIGVRMFMSLLLRRLSLLVVFCFSALSSVLAQPATIVAESGAGFGRMVITFDGENLVPPFTTSTNNNVLVLAFDEPVDTSIDGIAVTLRNYVGVARRDPNGQGLRFSLTRGTRINVQEAGEKLFVDFLPGSWVGLPPSLPEDVVRALAERAEKAFKAARAAEQDGRTGALRPRVEMRIGRHPSFTRLSFGWNTAYNAAFVRDGKSLAISFDTTAPLDLSALLADLPSGVEHAESFDLDDKLNVILTLADEADVRAFRDNDVYVVDITAPRSREASVLTGLDDSGRPETALLGGDLGSDIPDTPEGASQVSEIKGRLDVGASGSGLAAAKAAEAANSSQERLAEIVLDTGSYRRDDNPLADEPAAARAEAAPRPVPEASFSENDDAGSSVMLVDAGLNKTTASFDFQFNEDVSAALFRRNRTIWMVFDSLTPMELGLAKSVAGSIDATITKTLIRDATVIRIQLLKPLFANLTKRENSWIVTVGDSGYEPGQPLELKPIVNEQGLAEIKVGLSGVGRVHRIFDETAGDLITVTTSFDPAQSLLRGQRFAELEFLPTAHGLAVLALIDDLRVTPAENRVLYSRATGLSLSSKAQSRGFELTLDRLDGGQQTEQQDSLAELLQEARVDPGEPFQRAADAVFRQVALAPPKERPALRLEAARFYLANAMPHEAIGMIRLALAEQPALENEPGGLLLQAAAYAMARRPAEASRILSLPRLQDNADAAFWNTIAAADLRAWETSYSNIRRGRAVLGAYPEEVQQNFLLSGAESSLEYSDRAFSDMLLSEINPSALTRSNLAKYLLLRGRIAMQGGDTEGALRSWEQVGALGQRPESAEMDFRRLQYLYTSGAISTADMLQELAGLSLRWRGDEIELKSLRLLSELYAQDRQYRKSFQTMKTAVLVDRRSDTTRSLQNDIKQRFEDLFLHGGASALDPVESLALYYDFRELTPIGVKGDEMVRKLAARLIDVDLLSQAAQLLAHQVDNRLRGTARAQIAADLAFVYILNKEPHLALQAIRRTQQAQLPNLLDRQRRLLEAKALADIGKSDLAVTLMGKLQGTDADRLIAAIQWDAERWQNAAESYERVAGESWADPEPLLPVQRLDVLKAAIAYSLAADRLGIQRLRGKFAEKMGNSEDAAAFDVVTAPLEEQDIQFRSVSQQLGAADTMRTFMADYRRRYIAQSDGAMNPAANAPAAPAQPREATTQNDDGLAVDSNA